MEFRLTTIQLAQLVAKACGKVARLVTLPVGNNAGQVGKTGGSHLIESRPHSHALLAPSIPLQT